MGSTTITSDVPEQVNFRTRDQFVTIFVKTNYVNRQPEFFFCCFGLERFKGISQKAHLLFFQEMLDIFCQSKKLKTYSNCNLTTIEFGLFCCFCSTLDITEKLIFLKKQFKFSHNPKWLRGYSNLKSTFKMSALMLLCYLKGR